MGQTVYEITGASLSKELGVEIPDIYVVIAKHSVMGLDSDAIQQILACTREEIAEVESDGTYKIVRAKVAATYAAQSAEQTSGWDAIEDMALKGLVKRLPYEKDGEFLLKVAAVANRATRKHNQNNAVLDPSVRAGRTTINLTQRLVSKLNGQGIKEIEETREISIRDGSMGSPSFNEIDSLLSVRNVPVLPKDVEISTHRADPDQQSMVQDMLRRMGDKA